MYLAAPEDPLTRFPSPHDGDDVCQWSPLVDVLDCSGDVLLVAAQPLEDFGFAAASPVRGYTSTLNELDVVRDPVANADEE